ncbi:MAG: serine hydrolase [Acidobacteriota bacterium]|nr:class A beta-lactamase-related serine hydrolase [Blastocatellia bacterium]MDW8240333.1 serine hydrolase [Acidobacteriota bacterium]
MIRIIPLLVCLATATQTASRLADARAQIEQLIGTSGAEVAVAARTLDGKDELMIEPDKVFHAASTMKVAVMVELFNQVRAGKLRLDDPLTVKNQFHSIVDGSVYHLDMKSDSDEETYRLIGQAMTLEQLCDRMITVSSNLATNLLIEKLGVDNIRRTVAALGAEGLNILRGVEDSKAFEKGLNNTTTARGLLRLMESLAKGQAVDRKSSRRMVEILKRQKFNEAIPAGLPPGTPVAHKTGSITRIHHDAAIVYAKRPFVLVILVRGIEKEDVSAALMAKITELVYQATQ